MSYDGLVTVDFKFGARLLVGTKYILFIDEILKLFEDDFDIKQVDANQSYKCLLECFSKETSLLRLLHHPLITIHQHTNKLRHTAMRSDNTIFIHMMAVVQVIDSMIDAMILLNHVTCQHDPKGTIDRIYDYYEHYHAMFTRFYPYYPLAEKLSRVVLGPGPILPVIEDPDDSFPSFVPPLWESSNLDPA